MQLLFGASLILQLVLATHAYNHGRTSPWVWIILCFPLIGALLYASIFLLPSMRARSSAGIGRRVASPEKLLRDVPRGPFAPSGERPDKAIPVRSVAEIETQARREECPECGHALRIEEHRADTVAGRPLRVIITSCARCGATPVRYFELIGATH